jgi:hypothetical protein
LERFSQVARILSGQEKAEGRSAATADRDSLRTTIICLRHDLTDKAIRRSACSGY